MDIFSTVIQYLEWMHFTVPTSIAFLVVFSIIFLLIIFYKIRPSKPKKGFFPFPLQRGDRVFFGGILFMTIYLIWLATPFPIEYGLIPALLAFIIVYIWG